MAARLSYLPALGRSSSTSACGCGAGVERGGVGAGELAVAQRVAAVGDLQRGKVVGDKQDRGVSLVRDRAEQLHDLAAARAVEVPGRLVGEDQPWLAREHACDRDSLALAAGHFRWRVADPLAEPDSLEPWLRALLRLAHPHAADEQLACGVLERRGSRHQPESLVDEADIPQLVFADLPLGQGGEVAPVVADRAAVRLQERGDHQQQGRLAGAARAVQGDHFARVDSQRQAVHGVDLFACAPVALDDVRELQHGCGYLLAAWVRSGAHALTVRLAASCSWTTGASSGGLQLAVQLAAGQRQRAVGAREAGRLADAHQHGDALVGEAAKQRQDAIAFEDVHAKRGLVDHEQLWLVHERAGDPDEHRLGDVELARLERRAVRCVGSLERLVRAGACRRPVGCRASAGR